jgi:NADH-quinone oxidoreductase subunit L
MTVPLYVLAFLSIVGAVLALPENIAEHLHLSRFSWEVFTEGLFAQPRGGPPGHILPEIVTYGIALAIGWIGYFGALAYKKGVEGPPFWTKLPAGMHKAFENKLYVDEFYGWLIIRPLWAFARGTWRIVDVMIIDGLFVNGTAQVVAFVGTLARRFQNGDVQRYAAVTAAGVAVLVYVFLR